MYYNENITIYVKIFPAVNIHKRNIKGAHLLLEDIDYIMVLLQVHSYMHLFRILTTQIQNLKLNIRSMNIYLQLDIKASIKLKASIKYFLLSILSTKTNEEIYLWENSKHYRQAPRKQPSIN